MAAPRCLGSDAGPVALCSCALRFVQKKQPVANDGLLESLSGLVGLVPVAGEHVE